MSKPGTSVSKRDASMDWQKALLLVFAVLFLIGLAFITYLNPYPTDRQWFLYCTVLGLAGGGFAASLPGAIEWQVSPQLKTTGAVAVLVLFLVLGIRVTSSETGIKRWSLVPPAKGAAPNPNSATVYVDLDDKLVKHFGSRHPTLPVDGGKNSGIAIETESGGIVVDIERANPGQRLVYFVEDGQQWWVSPVITIPPSYPLQLMETTLTDVQKRTQ